MAELEPALPDSAAAAREDLCRFLAGCYYEPCVEFREERLFESIEHAATQIDPELLEHAQQLRRSFESTPLQDLLVDYTRLFLGAPQALAMPYASVWLSSEPELWQESTNALVQMYALGGFEMEADFKDLPDHVAVELEFLYLLNFRRNRAREAGDLEAERALAVLRTSFLDGHLGRWLGGFILALHDGALCDFYRELAEFTELFVRLEGQHELSAVAD